MKILQVAAEFHPLAKTGGLADMVASLSHALLESGEDVKVCMPAYPGCRAHLKKIKVQGEIRLFEHRIGILEGSLAPEASATDGLQILLLECPELLERAGDPYRDADGKEFSDNGWRFGIFNLAVAHVAQRGLGNWRPDLVHLHDWHTALVPALLAEQAPSLATVFTIHNFSFHGVFSREVFDALQLPAPWWHPEELEYYQQFSFMKAALKYADKVTVVSPRYAREIHQAEFGCGLEGVVAKYSSRISGIVNGIDETEWNPASDPYVDFHYTRRNVAGAKKLNKKKLQKELGLPLSDQPLFVMISRLAYQKGSDLLLEARTQLRELPFQLIVLGRGEADQEQAFQRWAQEQPQQLVAVMELNERLAHRLTAAADFQLIPSRFEPCGLSQMYAQRYGTLPVARATGGLADTITDIGKTDSVASAATGILFDGSNSQDLTDAIASAINLFESKRDLNRVRRQAMQREFGWDNSAKAYQDLYQELVPATAKLDRSRLTATA